MKDSNNRGFGCLLLGSVLLGLIGCGGAGSEPTTTPDPDPDPGTDPGVGTAGGSTEPVRPETAPELDLLTLIPNGAVVVLQADMRIVRQDSVRYDRFATELATELDLRAESPVLRQLLDLTDTAIGAFVQSAGRREGFLVFHGRFIESDFERALSIATARHGSTPTPTTTADGRTLYPMGNATIAQLDQFTFAVAEGEALRAHLAAVQLNGERAFSNRLTEFGPRIGLPLGSAQAWASQETQVGTDMVGLVFAGENPQMVRNFVSTVQHHLGL